MVTRIYLWKPSSAKSFGHISLELSDRTYVSWWPSVEMTSVMEAVAGTSAKYFETFEKELQENGNPDKTLNMFGLNEDNIKAYFKRLLDGSVKWDLMKRSCSNVIYNALCEGSDWFKGRAGDTTTPESVASLVEAYVNDKKDKKDRMVTRIYVWKPSGAKSFGHISLELSDRTYVSWWPSQQLTSVVEALTGTSAKWFDTFESELQETGNPEKTLNMFGLNEDNIKAYFKRLLAGSKKWDLTKRSCSNVIYHALCEGSDWFKGRAGDTTTPSSVATLVEAYVNDKKDKKVKMAAFCK